jgi:hypothetical protein
MTLSELLAVMWPELGPDSDPDQRHGEEELRTAGVLGPTQSLAAAAFAQPNLELPDDVVERVLRHSAWRYRARGGYLERVGGGGVSAVEAYRRWARRSSAGGCRKPSRARPETRGLGGRVRYSAATMGGLATATAETNHRTPPGPRLPRLTRLERLQPLYVRGGVLALLATGVVAVLLSPLLLRLLAERSSADWESLSHVGETYGAASALLSALALAAIAASLFYQARQAAGLQIQTVRMLHVELTKMALAEPELFLPCWRPIDAPTIAGKRQHLYQNLLITYVWMSYELNGLTETEIRVLLSKIFEGEAARRYWRRVQADWMPTWASDRGRGRRFREIVTEEFDNACKRRPTGSPAWFEPDAVEPPPAVDRRRIVWSDAAGGVLIAAGGVAVGALLSRRRS